MRIFFGIISLSVLAAALAITVASKLHEPDVPQPAVSQRAPAPAAQPLPPEPAQPTLTYQRIEIPDRPRWLREHFTPQQLRLLEKLNRADLKHIGRLRTVVVPSRWDLDELAYSPLPARYAGAEQTPKLIVVDLPGQVFGAYEYGRLARWGPVSSGRPGALTPEGLFHLTWKAKLHESSDIPDEELAWVFNFGLHRGLHLHSYALPGRPASHACVRLLDRDAEWVYHWGDQWKYAHGRVLEPGTPVLIVGAYDHAAPPPWQSPEWWARQIELPPWYSQPAPPSGVG